MGLWPRRRRGKGGRPAGCGSGETGGLPARLRPGTPGSGARGPSRERVPAPHPSPLARRRASVILCPPGLLGGIADPALGEHLQRVGLDLAGVIEDGLDSVCSGSHGVSLLQVRHVFRQNRQGRAVWGPDGPFWMPWGRKTGRSARPGAATGMLAGDPGGQFSIQWTWSMKRWRPGRPGAHQCHQPCWFRRASISAKSSPVSRWIRRTQDLAEFSTAGVPKGSWGNPCRFRAALRMLDQL